MSDVTESVSPSSPSSPSSTASTPSPSPSRQRVVLAAAVAVLVGLVIFAVALEGNAVAHASDRLRRQWGQDDAVASDRVAARQFYDNNENADPLAARPKAATSSDDGEQWMQRMNVPAAELLHLSLLQAACLDHKDSIIPWTYGRSGAYQESPAHNAARLVNQDDPKLLEKLRLCPDVDIYLSGPLRSHGYCEDAIVYSKFLKSRLLPRWAIEAPIFDTALGQNVTYADLCPHTPMLFFNHFWDGLHELPTWPKQKPIYLMPNIEMYELNEKHLWRADVVLCKTLVCMDRLTRWYKQEGNPRNTQVLYTRHTTSDVAHFARHTLGAAAIKPKDFTKPKFIHTAGASAQKGTRQVVECWLSRPDFPPLDLVIKNDSYQWMFGPPHNLDARVRSATNIRLLNTQVKPIEFGRMIAEAAFFLCTSVMEGYGHYINQARASGGVIVTTDAPPMNELIASGDMGVFVDATLHKDGGQFLGGASTAPHALRNVSGMVGAITKEGVCSAVEQLVFHTKVWQREAMATRAREQYHVDTAFFAREMLRLCAFARRRRQELEQQP
ncbi:hypothetical protein PybrP1_007075 [[Pythium] brassicae (nom. inval.)]|nr:hypothetical protein PybrP1_007075 [[Pythium] brassicae (nom. inval.)]